MAVVASRLAQYSPRAVIFDSALTCSKVSSVRVAPLAFRPVTMASASVLAENAIVERDAKAGVGGLASVATDVAGVALRAFKTALERKPLPLQGELIVESGIVNCRFFTLFAVAGSLVGSILCLVEGSFLILESFYEYFRHMSHTSDQGQVMQLLIEALDCFLVGNAMLIFGMGIYIMFVGSRQMKEGGSTCLTQGSNFFGFFHLRRVPSWVDVRSLAEVKSKIGHAVVMILQAGVLENIRNVNITTPVDLACFAGAILLSSASIFLLSKLK